MITVKKKAIRARVRGSLELDSKAPALISNPLSI